jgi:hypothetical protein
MPIEMENALKKEAQNKYGSTTSKSARALIFGTMRHKLGWKPSREKKFGK